MSLGFGSISSINWVSLICESPLLICFWVGISLIYLVRVLSAFLTDYLLAFYHMTKQKNGTEIANFGVILWQHSIPYWP